MRRFAVPLDVDELALDARSIAAVARERQHPAAARGCSAPSVFRLDEKPVEAARLGERGETGVAAPGEKHGVCIEQLVEPIDEDADRKLVEQRQRDGRGYGRKRGAD